MKSVLASLLILSCLSAYSQSKIEVLENMLAEAESDSLKVALLNQLSTEARPNDFAKAREYAERAKTLAEKSGDKPGIAKSLLNSGMALYFQGDHEQAIDQYLKSLNLYESLNDSRGIVMVLNELGTLEKKNNDIDGSEKHLARALELSKQLGDSSLVAHSMNNLGHVYELQGNLDKAMETYRESAEIKERLGDFYGASFNYDNMGNILAKQGKYLEAKKYFDKEIIIFERLGDRMAHAIAVNNMGEMYTMQGNHRKAREYLTQALAVSKEIGYKDLRRHIYSVISDTYKQEQNFEKAFEYFVLSAALRDSIFNENKSKQLLDLQARYENEKKENEIRFLKQENELKDFGLRQNRLFILGLILVVLGMGIVGYLWQNRTRLKQKVELETTRASLRETQLQAVIASQEVERKRFAADLHDGLGQIISALRLSLSKENPEKNTVDHALSLLNDMNVEIRNIAFNLMPQSLMKEGLEEALREFASRINRSGNIRVDVSAFNVNSKMTAEHKVALYRVCQEWVNNVIKYSQCKNISLQLVQHPEELVVSIEDDGIGFDTAGLVTSQGNGWKNINSRVSLIKGDLEIDSRPGHPGTTLIITIPLYALAV